jgi:outer membrane murein-binding lipoprotein Lpp
MLSLVGLKDDWGHDGRLLDQDLSGYAIPAAVKMNLTDFNQLADAYKQLNASFGTFAMNILKASTHALASNDGGDSTYNSIEGQIQSLTSQRDALAAQIKAALDTATFDNQPLDSAQVQSWLSQAQSLQDQAAALAGP